MRLSNACVALVFTFILLGCQKQDSSGSVIARVDDQTLTMEQVRAQVDTSRPVSQAQLQQYIQQWLTEEILYREAVRRGLDRSEHVNTRLRETRRQLAINGLLEQEVYHDRVAPPLVSYVLFRQRDAATSFRNSVLGGTPWPNALRETLGNPEQASLVVASMDSIYHTQASLFPPELWRVSVAVNVREPSFPINTSDGYYVLITWRLMRQGQQPDFRYVADEIRGRITVERRRRIYDSLLENLRAQHSVEVFTTSAIADTASDRRPLD
ncbi:MAG: hypothetical protein HYW57_02145 [Ignavibacteriales bacterium]|nr:hypothetical protein [Ignavibacteriales bacterium]